MKIKRLSIRNFRLFGTDRPFEVDSINIPDGITEGSGLTAFVGENGCGKSSILDALALPMLSYKAESFSIKDFFDPAQKTLISVFSEKDFEVKGTMPKVTFKAKGFHFEAGVRTRDNKAYLSSIVVNDQKFIKADGQSKPDDNSPDLRVAVNNPFSGQRFAENDVLFLDKNRTYQSRSGTFNTTRFDRLMEDMNYQYIKKNKPLPDLSIKMGPVAEGISNDFLDQAIGRFKKICGIDLSLDLVNNSQPFKEAFFSNKTVSNHQISLEQLGSGFEMIFSVLYSFSLSVQSKKQLIILFDEPELHLHPALQRDFVKLLLESSKTAQIILTTHSPLLVKQLLTNENVAVKILRNRNAPEIVSIGERLLPYLSASEINYIAFDLASEEYHNELYEELKHLYGSHQNYKEFDNSYFVSSKGEQRNSAWKGVANEVSLHTCIRNQIHHPKENGKPKIDMVEQSIEKMRLFLKSP